MTLAENKTTQSDERRLTEQLAPLFHRPEISLVVLFGSAATGRRHRRSDLDIAILGDMPLDLVELTNRVMTLTHANDVDLVDLRRASPLLAMEVARHGRLLYERSAGDHAQFVSLAYRRYVDTAKLRAAQKEAIAGFLRERGLA
jgi:predicted nucleotidyltransferase